MRTPSFHGRGKPCYLSLGVTCLLQRVNWWKDCKGVTANKAVRKGQGPPVPAVPNSSRTPTLPLQAQQAPNSPGCPHGCRKDASAGVIPSSGPTSSAAPSLLPGSCPLTSACRAKTSGPFIPPCSSPSSHPASAGLGQPEGGLRGYGTEGFWRGGLIGTFLVRWLLPEGTWLGWSAGLHVHCPAAHCKAARAPTLLALPMVTRPPVRLSDPCPTPWETNGLSPASPKEQPSLGEEKGSGVQLVLLADFVT